MKREKERERVSPNRPDLLGTFWIAGAKEWIMVRVPAIMAQLKATLWRECLSECDPNTQRVEQNAQILMGNRKHRGIFLATPFFQSNELPFR